MTTDFLGHLVAASLDQTPGVRPRLAVRFERPLATPALGSGASAAGLAAPAPVAAEPAPVEPGGTVDVLEPATARLKVSSVVQAISSPRPAELTLPAMPPPATLQDNLAPPMDESPATGPGRLQRSVAGQPQIRPSAVVQERRPTALPVTHGLKAQPDTAASLPDREQSTPSQVLKPQSVQPAVQPGDHRVAARPAAVPTAPSPILVTPGAFSSEPVSPNRLPVPGSARAPIQAGPSRRPAGLASTTAAVQALPGRQVLAESAPSTPQVEVQARPRDDEPTQLPASFLIRPASESDLAQPDAVLWSTSAMQELGREAIAPRRQIRPDGPSALSAGSGPTIRVTIGRIEVRANVLPEPQPQAKPGRRQPPLPLDAYLRRRNQGHGDHQ